MWPQDLVPEVILSSSIHSRLFTRSLQKNSCSESDNVWNSLPINFVTTKTLNTFKNMFDSHQVNVIRSLCVLDLVRPNHHSCGYSQSPLRWVMVRIN
ncbi:hypothetical protein PoB_007714100 [Plakobranchus ocellatus]|uniref:Uncharacterized protein n=1 Tax=Plakobranchus ocellatus TaxID=259542 RepID=A0AAV4E4I2_9GAST|nr:hypothetical protein PoB_007714100 [Plakobranchus ocellatus]